MPAESDNPLGATAWTCNGLFSDHFLTRRLIPTQETLVTARTWLPELRSLLDRVEPGLVRGNEEDCEDRWINPLLDRLGHSTGNRRRLGSSQAAQYPDVLLYTGPEASEHAFKTGD